MKLLLVIIILSYSHEMQPFDITITSIKSGILPFKLGRARLLQDYHPFFYYYNLNDIKIEIEKIEHEIDQTYEILSKTELKSAQVALENYLEQINAIISQIRSKFTNIKPVKFNKRQLAEQAMDMLQQLTNALMSVLAEPMKVLKDEFVKVIKTSDKQLMMNEVIQKNISELFRSLAETNKVSNDAIDVLYNNSLNLQGNFITYNSFSSAFDLIITNGNRLLDFLENLEDAIAYAKRNQFHPSIINNLNFEAILEKLKETYHPDHLIQFKDSTSYYDAAFSDVRFDKNIIIFGIFFPVVENKVYDFYKLYPVPYKNITLLPISTYLAINELKSYYHLSSCEKIEDIFICVDPMESVEDDCLPNYIKKNETKSCNLQYSYVRKSVLEHISPDYILSVPDYNGVEVICDCSTKKFLKLTEPTLFRIPPSCSLTVDNVRYSNLEGYSLQEPVSLRNLLDDKIPKLAMEDVLRNGFLLPEKEEADIYQTSFFIFTLIFLSLLVVSVICLLISEVYIQFLTQ